MESSKTEEKIHEVRVIETDEAAVIATVRRFELYTGVISAIYLAVAIYAFCIYAPLSHDPLFYKVVTVLICTCLILLGLLHFISPLCLKKMDVLIGSDFIAGPDLCGLGSFFMRMAGHKTILGYNDIIRVHLDISKGRITGATVVGKGSTMILVKRVKEPQTVIRVILEHTGPEVQWSRSLPRFRKLSREDIDSLINKGEKKNFDEQ